MNVSNPVRAPETFYVAPGVYDWNKDAQGVYFLNAAVQRGVPSLTAFVNSAPAPMTAGKTSCNSQFVTGEDRIYVLDQTVIVYSIRYEGSGAAYGTFLADVLSHFRGQGINISYISPMNEPDSSFGPSPCGQEGMQVVPNQYASIR